MVKEKACKNCKIIYVGTNCPACDKKETTDGFKGKVEIINPEESIIATNLKISKKGTYAIKL